jgi:transcriptional regulator with GAF, ATPase, and Fis domain
MLFLDEIGDMPLSMQAKLLRVLEEGEVERVGGGKPVAVDARVIVATHRNLESLVRDGQFRQDLFHRVFVFPISLPPLRDRRDDIPVLLEAFAVQLCAQEQLEAGDVHARGSKRCNNTHGWEMCASCAIIRLNA